MVRLFLNSKISLDFSLLTIFHFRYFALVVRTFDLSNRYLTLLNSVKSTWRYIFKKFSENGIWLSLFYFLLFSIRRDRCVTIWGLESVNHPKLFQGTVTYQTNTFTTGLEIYRCKDSNGKVHESYFLCQRVVSLTHLYWRTEGVKLIQTWTISWTCPKFMI